MWWICDVCYWWSFPTQQLCLPTGIDMVVLSNSLGSGRCCPIVGVETWCGGQSLFKCQFVYANSGCHNPAKLWTAHLCIFRNRQITQKNDIALISFWLDEWELTPQTQLFGYKQLKSQFANVYPLKSRQASNVRVTLQLLCWFDLFASKKKSPECRCVLFQSSLYEHVPMATKYKKMSVSEKENDWRIRWFVFMSLQPDKRLLFNQKNSRVSNQKGCSRKRMHNDPASFWL